MVDLQTIELRDVLKVTGVGFVPDSSPATLSVQGEDFRNASEVYINETLSPSVIIDSSKLMLVQVPEAIEGGPITSIVVVSSRLTRTDRSKVMFRISDSPTSIDGMERLIQTFLKIMLQSPRTDIFAPQSGGGLLRSVGKQVRNPSTATMVSDFHLAVTRARQQLVNIQAKDPTLTLSERLLYAKVLEAKFVPNELALLGKILLTNQTGRTGVVGLGL